MPAWASLIRSDTRIAGSSENAWSIAASQVGTVTG
jgi:hypothetical protein